LIVFASQFLRDDENTPRGTSVRDIIAVLSAFLPNRTDDEVCRCLHAHLSTLLFLTRSTDVVVALRDRDAKERHRTPYEKKRKKSSLGERHYSISSDSHSERDVSDIPDGLEDMDVCRVALLAVAALGFVCLQIVA
jgi:hypothetical protein